MNLYRCYLNVHQFTTCCHDNVTVSATGTVKVDSLGNAWMFGGHGKEVQK